MSPRQWILSFFGLVLLLGASLATVNWTVDPTYCFDRSRENRIIFDDRHQKSADLHFSPEVYDGLIIGSSRVKRLLNLQSRGDNIFNYGMNDLIPSEVEKYITFAKEENSKPFHYILIGMDFFNTNTHRFMRVTWKDPKFYFDAMNDPFFQLKALLSNSSLKYSLQYYMGKGHRSFKINQDWNFKHFDYYNDMYEQYKWNDQIPTTLAELKHQNQHSNITVFTTAVSQPLFELMILHGRWPEYKRWLRLLVENFDQIHHFMDINDVTINPKYFRDENHLQPEIASWMIDRTLGRGSAEIPQNFGTVLTKDNIDEYLSGVEDEIAAFEYSEIKRVSPPGVWD